MQVSLNTGITATVEFLLPDTLAGTTKLYGQCEAVHTIYL